MNWDKTADVVVVGLGAAGGCAAIEAHDNGAKVLVIEADKVPGGNTRLSGGTLRVFLDADKVYEYYRAVFDETVSDELTHKLIDVTMSSHEWFKEKTGCDFRIAEKRPFPPAPNAVWSYLPGAEALGGRSQFVPRDGGEPNMNGGYYLIRSLMHGVNDRNIEIMYQTRGIELIQNADKEIIGIKALKDGKEINIRAKKAVCLTCGGFERNPEMQLNYLSMPLMSQGTMENKGDGIVMAAKVGAKMWHMTGLSCGVGYKVKDHEQPIAIGMYASNYLYVDQHGHRFLNEAGLDVHAMAFDFTMCEAETMSYPRMPSWMIFDENVREAGPIIGHCPGIIQEDPTFEGWSKDNKREIEKGWIVEAYTIEELGQKIGYAPGVLEKCVAEYNKAALTGWDEQFHRNCYKMGPITRLPFYAIQLWPSLLNTQGGPQHDEYGRVLDYDMKPIPRLYEAGEFGSIVNKFYPGGTNITECVAMGRVIGEETAKLSDSVE